MKSASAISPASANRSMSFGLYGPASSLIFFLMTASGILIRFIIKYFLKTASASSSFLRLCSGVNPSSITAGATDACGASYAL